MDLLSLLPTPPQPLAVVPVLVGPLQVLLTLLPAVLLALASAVVSVIVAVIASLHPSALKNTLRVLWRQKVQVLTCGALLFGLTGGTVFGLVWGGRWVWGKLRPAAGQSEEGTQDWTMARGSLLRRGAADEAVGPNGGGLNWSWKAGSEAFFSSPTLVGNRVYVASAVFGAFDSSGQIYCFDADTGAVAWKNAPSGYRPTFSSPVVSGNYLVCGEGLHTTREARVICLDLRPGHEGNTVWTFATQSHVECTPVVHEGRVYVGAGDDGYYCLELEPSPVGNALRGVPEEGNALRGVPEEGNAGPASPERHGGRSLQSANRPGEPRVVWHVPGEQYVDAETSLAVHDGKVYAGLGVGGRALCVLDAATGRELARLPLPFPVFSPPAIANGKLYLGMGNGDFANSAAKLLAAELERLQAEGRPEAELAAARQSLTTAGEVRCIDLTTRQTDWTFPTGDTVLGAVAVAEDTLYFGSRDGHLYALSRDGKLQGQWNSRAGIVTSPAVTAEHVYVVNEAGLLFAVERRTLTPVWEFRLGSATSLVGTPPLFISSPAVGRGRVYVGTQYDGLLCLGEASTVSRVPLWPGHLGGPGAGGSLDGSPLPELGEVAGSYPPEPPDETSDPTIQGPVAAHEENLLVPIASGPLKGLACLPLDAKQNPSARWHYPTRNGVYLSPAAVGEQVFLVDGKRGDKGRDLHALLLESGRVQWQAGLAPAVSGVCTVGEDAVWIQSAPATLAALSLDGKPLWSRQVGELAHAPAVTPTLLIIAAVNPPALLALDRPTGLELWRVPLDNAPLTSPAIAGAVIYFGASRGLEARSIVDGAELPNWQFAGGLPAGELALCRGRVAYVNSAGELVLKDGVTGKVERKVEGLVPGSAPLVARDTLLLVSESQLLRWPFNQPAEEPAEWLDTSPQGRVTSPPVLHGGNLYFGTSRRGLVQAGEVAGE